MGAGRPVEYTEERLKEIIDLLEKYIEESELPIVSEFAYQNDIRKATLYDHPELSYYVRKLCEKKESTLEKKGLSGDYNASMAKFSLSQLGWSEKQETQHTTIDDNGEPTGFSIEFIK